MRPAFLTAYYCEPVVLIDPRSYQKVDYTGEKSVEAMAGFVKKAIALGVIAVTAETLQSKVNAEDVFYLLVHEKTDVTSLELVKEPSKVLLSTSLIYSSLDSAFLIRFDLSANLDAGVLVRVKEADGKAVKHLVSNTSARAWSAKRRGDVADEEQVPARGAAHDRQLYFDQEEAAVCRLPCARETVRSSRTSCC